MASLRRALILPHLVFRYLMLLLEQKSLLLCSTCMDIDVFRHRETKKHEIGGRDGDRNVIQRKLYALQVAERGVPSTSQVMSSYTKLHL